MLSQRMLGLNTKIVNVCIYMSMGKSGYCVAVFNQAIFEYFERFSEHGIFQAPYRYQSLIQDGVIARYIHAAYSCDMA